MTATPPTTRSRGVLYVAGGHDRYVREAATAAGRLREVMGDLPLTLVTDRDDTPGPWDEVRRIAPGGDGYRTKVVALCDLPYDRTLYLDTDTYVVSDLSDLFTLLDHVDLAAAHAPNRATLTLDGVPAAFPECNTGVLALRRCPEVAELSREWLAEYDRLAPLGPPSYDQVSFRSVLYRGTVRFATLTPEYNCRFMMAGFVSAPVKVLHGRASTEQYRELARILTDGLSDDPARFGANRVHIAETVLRRTGEGFAAEAYPPPGPGFG